MAKLPDDDDLPAGPDMADIPPMAEPMDYGPAMGDDEALRKIKRRSSTTGKIVAVLLIVGCGALGFWWYTNSQAYEQRWDWRARAEAAETDEQVIAILREQLPKAEHDDVKESIILNLGVRYKDAQSVPLIIPFLDEAGIVRRAAARALASIGSPAADAAKDKLMQVLPDTNEIDRSTVVWACAVLKESRAASEIIAEFTRGTLQEQEGFDPKVIVDVLGPSRLASNELLNHDQQSVRQLVAQALSEAASPEVVAPLATLLRQELARPVNDTENPQRAQSPEVIRSAAAGLGRTGEASAAAPLFELLQAQPNMRQSVLESLKRSTGANGLITLVREARDDATRRDMVRLLAETHDPRAKDALAGLLDHADPDVKSTAALGLAELGDERAIPALLQLAADPEDSVAMPALEAIKLMRAPSAAEGLAALLPQFLARRATILRALGTTGNTAAAPAIRAELEGDDVRAAAMALADLQDDEGYRFLLGKLPRPRDIDMSQPLVSNEELFLDRTAAVVAMGAYGRPDANEALMTIVEDPMDDARLRINAAIALGHTATPEVIQQLVGKIRDTNVDETARRFYVQSLWQKPDRANAAQLFDVIVSDAPAEVKRTASLGIGYMGDPANDERLSQMLDSEATRREAAFAVVLGGSRENARKLVGLLRQDRDLRDILQTEIMSTDSDYFDLLTRDMFESGQVWRRIEVAQVLRQGEGQDSYSYIWGHLLNRLKLGQEGARGVTPRFVREKMWEALVGQDANRRSLAAEILGAMGERGLLLAARDAGQAGSEEARRVLRSLNAPASAASNTPQR